MIVIRRVVDRHRAYTALLLPGEPARIFPTSDDEHARILRLYLQDRPYVGILNDFTDFGLSHPTPTPSMAPDTSDLLDRFCRYTRIDTRSNPHSPSTPSTPGQWTLLRLLASELQELGAHDILVTDNGFTLASIPASIGCEHLPTIAWFAHVDTATDLPGAASPIIHRAWDGSPISFPDDPALSLSTDNCPALRSRIGHDIITASGSTLLGADDKAGIAAIMAATRTLLRTPSIPRPHIRLVFTPDEEIGRGIRHLDLNLVRASAAYTVDGDDPGTLDEETFCADAATISIRGVSIHPGWAKDVMVNALRLAGRLLAALPTHLTPESTSGRQGFIHPTEISGTPDHATLHLILRDFEPDGLAFHRSTLSTIVDHLRSQEPRASLSLTFTEQYRNMRQALEAAPHITSAAHEAIRRAGLTPRRGIIRGGTDGSQLTARGLPCPNLFAGMQEVHSRREWVSLADMSKAAETLTHLATLWSSPLPKNQPTPP